MTPADTVIEAFGGAPKLAKALRMDQSNVNRWRKEKNGHGGCGGMIPQRHWKAIMTAAQERNIPLTMEHIVFGRNDRRQVTPMTLGSPRKAKSAFEAATEALTR